MKKLGRPSKKIEFIIDDNNCFICTSHSKGKWGHCTITINNKSTTVYRHIYEECFETIPEGIIVRHRCDNGSCINPEHLELGTQKQNLSDMVERNRSRKGVKHHNFKLTETEVESIILNKEKLTIDQLSEKYGVSKRQVFRIRSGERWSHVKQRLEDEGMIKDDR